MDMLLIILAFFCLAAGVLGSVLPALPGPPLAWLGLLLAGFTDYADVSTTVLIVTACLAAVITVLDYVVPSLSTKHFGGSKYGIWGCNIGLVVSLFGLPFGPTGLLGVVFWPFVGALIGEYIKAKDLRPSLRAAWGAFVGFLTGTGLKFVYAIVLAVIIARDLFV